MNVTEFAIVYGMTESSATVAMTPVHDTPSPDVQSKSQSIGPPCVNMQMKVSIKPLLRFYIICPTI